MKQFTIKTRSKTDFLNIDKMVQTAVQAAEINDGIITIFIPHTTAGIIINENTDPNVLNDLATIFDRLVPWTGGYQHSEGNTAAHAKTVLAGSSVQVIVQNGQLQLGTWQSLFLCEFDGPRTRTVWVKE